MVVDVGGGTTEVAVLRTAIPRSHCFRATGITAYLKNGGALEKAPHPEAAVLRKDILDRHPERRTDARERIDHDPDQGAGAQAGMTSGVDAVHQRAQACAELAAPSVKQRLAAIRHLFIGSSPARSCRSTQPARCAGPGTS
jgi:hypothetical protein